MGTGVFGTVATLYQVSEGQTYPSGGSRLASEVKERS
jgi:hypothetical protein